MLLLFFFFAAVWMDCRLLDASFKKLSPMSQILLNASMFSEKYTDTEIFRLMKHPELLQANSFSFTGTGKPY